MFPPETKILVVDDMMTTRKLVKKALKSLGFADLTDCDNGEKGFVQFKEALVAKKPFELIVSDWNMPVMTGIQFLKAVRTHTEGSATPFVLLTAESEKSQVLEALKAKVSGYVIKPFTPEALKAKLEQVYAAQNTAKAA